MSKKHYIAVATKIKQRKDDKSLLRGGNPDLQRVYEVALRDMANDMADVFATYSPNFDRQRFIAACGF